MVASPHVNLNGFRIASGHDCEDELRMRSTLSVGSTTLRAGAPGRTRKACEPKAVFLKLCLLRILFTAAIRITNTLHSEVARIG